MFMMIMVMTMLMMVMMMPTKMLHGMLMMLMMLMQEPLMLDSDARPFLYTPELTVDEADDVASALQREKNCSCLW